ncbi:MAG: penicillin-binding protein 1C [Gammaproteobacteria bacterium]|nr:penicillin-binding protein 1C [Gammaproteobacteria bacterium]
MRNWLARTFKFLFFIICLTTVTFFVLDKWFPFQFPNEESYAQVVVDNNGQPLRVFADKNGVWRYPVTVKQVSPFYLEALIEYEDRWFYFHPGVNPLALFRAIGQWVWYGKPVSGGSTITMQVARLFHPHSKSVSGKLYQIFRALQLEWHLSKQEILTLYLNHAPFGGPIEGVQAASFSYLGKSANQLTRAEGALLSVLPQSPSRLRPDRFPERAEQARNKVMNRLREFNVWTDLELQDAFKEPVIAQYNIAPNEAPLLARHLIQQLPKQRVIHSTIDRDLQLTLRQLLRDYIESFPKQTSGAILIAENKTSEIKAYLGSADFSNNDRYGHIDMIRATRSPGSTLKPFLFGIGIDQGIIHEQSMLLDVPANFSGYRPENFTKGFSGIVSAREALQRSLNVPAVQLLDAIGPHEFYTRLAQTGLVLQLPSDSKPNLSMILGGAGTNLLQLVTAYSSLGREGMVQPLKLYHSSSVKDTIPRKLLSPGAAWIIGDILREVSLSDLPGSLAQNSTQKIAFKTGTSYGFRDAWVIAVNSDFTIGIWLGRPDGTPLLENSGRNNAVPLLRRVLMLLPKPNTAITRPNNIAKEIICWPLGSVRHSQQDNWCRKSKQAWLLDGVAPVSLKEPLMQPWSSYIATLLLDKQGQRVFPDCVSEATSSKTIALWPVSAEPWLPIFERRERLLPKISTLCKSNNISSQLTIEGVLAKSILYRLPNQSGPISINLLAVGAQGDVNWFLNGEYYGRTETKHELEMQLTGIGPQRINVIDSSGQLVETEFTVAR